jgi:hypothetical protein
MTKTKTKQTPGQALEAARKALYEGEARGLGDRAMERLWQAFFAAERAARIATGGW